MTNSEYNAMLKEHYHIKGYSDQFGSTAVDMFNGMTPNLYSSTHGFSSSDSNSDYLFEKEDSYDQG